MTHLAHPALDLIQRLERMWAETDQIAFDRASVIVKALIEVKLVEGEFWTRVSAGGDIQDVKRSFYPAEVSADAAATLDDQPYPKDN